MNRFYHAIRNPVRRPGADRYLLITLLSFAMSVSLTRIFLELTGYPQLGGSTLHIAHVLWGGLLLFIAALLPLIIANRWVYQATAILSGIGIGLFIDEVGKFITQTNDYFYPPAAPIIYAFFLICVMIYFQVNRRFEHQTRSELYVILEMLEDVLDHDLDPNERAEIEVRLQRVTDQEDQPELAHLARAILSYFQGEYVRLAPIPPYYLKTIEKRIRNFEARYIDRKRLHLLLTFGIGVLGIFAVTTSCFNILNGIRTGQTGDILLFPIQEASSTFTYWFLILQIFQLLVGLVLVAGAVQLASGREQQGLRGSYLSLLVYLTMVDLLLFYYYQFSTILVAVIQFCLLLGVLYYRERYLTSTVNPIQPIESETSST